MTYKEVIDTLEEMRSRFDSGFSTSDRKLIDSIHSLIFGKRVVNTYCKDCWRDAYILVFNKLKKMGQMPKEAEYVITPGEVLHVFGSQTYFTGAIETSVAEDYLKRYPKRISIFSKYPEDWEARINASNNVKKRPGTNTSTETDTALDCTSDAKKADEAKPVRTKRAYRRRK